MLNEFEHRELDEIGSLITNRSLPLKTRAEAAITFCRLVTLYNNSRQGFEYVDEQNHEWI